MKRNIAYLIIYMAASWLVSSPAAAGTLDSLQLRGRVGYNIGGTMPIPLPETIRSIDSYSLTPSFLVGFDAMLPLNRQWGVMTGLRLENKGMKGDQKMSGLFTGHVEQEVKAWMLTVPVQATFTLSQRVMLKGGPYVSFLLSKGFNGIASDGYLRKDSPTGPKILMGNREGEWATYDFDSDMRSVQFGVGLGVDWQVYKRLGVSADLNWGLTGIFPSDFKTVEQTLYPVYGTIGVFYRLK